MWRHFLSGGEKKSRGIQSLIKDSLNTLSCGELQECNYAICYFLSCGWFLYLIIRSCSLIVWWMVQVPEKGCLRVVTDVWQSLRKSQSESREKLLLVEYYKLGVLVNLPGCYGGMTCGIGGSWLVSLHKRCVGNVRSFCMVNLYSCNCCEQVVCMMPLFVGICWHGLVLSKWTSFPDLGTEALFRVPVNCVVCKLMLFNKVIVDSWFMKEAWQLGHWSIFSWGCLNIYLSPPN